MVFNEQGRVFLVKRGPDARNECGKWDFPGGGVEFGERYEEAIKREIKEEFNMDIEVVELLEVVSHIIPKENQHWVSPSYIARHLSGEPRIMEPRKTSEIKWIDISQISIALLSEPSKSNFLKFKNKYGDNYKLN